MNTTPEFIDDVIELVSQRQKQGQTRIYLTTDARNELFHDSSTAAVVVDQNQPSPNIARFGPASPTPTPHTSYDNQPQTSPAPSAPEVEIIAEGDSLEDLQAVVAQCTACPLHTGRTQTVFGAGNPKAELMFIGDSPDADEDRSGHLLKGRAGQLLARMISAMQFACDDVYIANVVKCRPPGNRNPKDDEAGTCLPYLKRQIELVKPKVIVLLGGVALQHLLGSKNVIAQHGKWQDYMGIPTLATYHPSILLRSPKRKKEAWEDLQNVMRKLGKDPEDTLRKMKTANERSA